MDPRAGREDVADAEPLHAGPSVLAPTRELDEHEDVLVDVRRQRRDRLRSSQAEPRNQNAPRTLDGIACRVLVLDGPAHDPARLASRAGHTDGELAFGGRRVRVRRPRVRGIDGAEIPLETWERFAGADPLTPRAVEQMVLGVSTRKYVRSIEPAPPEVTTRGTSKSAMSRRFVAATRAKLAELMSRDLTNLSLCALLIDGIHVGEHVVLIALGIDVNGEKHILGLYEGATENTVCCAGLISDLEARGVWSERTLLFVIDASKALAKAIRANGYKGMPKLVAALRAHDHKLKPATVDASAEAA